MKKFRKYWQEQTVHKGCKVFNVGFKSNLAKILDGLRKETYETIILKNVPVVASTATMGLPGVKKLIIQNAGILEHGAVFSMDDLEELEILGSVGHLHNVFTHSCPKLKKITINANVFTTDNFLIFPYCEHLHEISIQGVLPANLAHVTDDWDNAWEASHKEIPTKFPFDNYRTTIATKTEEEREEIKQTLLATSKWVKKVYGHDKYIDYAIGIGGIEMWSFISDIFNSWNRAYKLRKIGWKYSNEKESPTVLSLKLSRPYHQDDKCGDIRFRYASVNATIFENFRRRFHLWKVAGKGRDIDKMIRICRWIHECIPHKGDAIPKVIPNLGALMDATHRIGKPGNCLIQAICLCEALLSIGFKARYIKGYQRDSRSRNYHVFVSAWSHSLKKWIFLDPTYGAYVMDLSGQMLSPTEIRNNLINDIPMQVNEEADYNGNKEMAKVYLKEFLAGNMYYLVSNTISRDSTEKYGRNNEGEWIVLAPTGEESLHDFGKVITDEAVFWQPPE